MRKNRVFGFLTVGGAKNALLRTLLLFSVAAHAHDSWLSPVPTPVQGEALFELSAGNRFPVQEVGASPQYLDRSTCMDGQGRALPMRPDNVGQKALSLRVRGLAGPGMPLSCWIELQAYDIELQPQLIPVYLAEIRPPAAVREAWAAMQARGLPWRESFRKYARIEAMEVGTPTPAQRAAARKPAGMTLEIVLLGDGPVAVGEDLRFQVLRDGKPLAAFATELVSERSPLGIWRTTDSQGMVSHKLPFGGRWLLRGTDLRVSQKDADRWDSWFVTLTVEAPVPPLTPPSPLSRPAGLYRSGT